MRGCIKSLFFSVAAFSMMLAYPALAADNQITDDKNPLYHAAGGFSIRTPENAQDAAADGIEYTILYSYPIPLGSATEKTLRDSHITEIDGFIASNLAHHECYRERTVKQHSGKQFCSESQPSDITEEILLQKITAHLQDVQKNYSLVKGFWVLDDQPIWDNGYAKPLLQKIHALIQQYTPGKPAVCGFGSSLDLKGHPRTDSNLSRFDSFSPDGCDMVALYVYAQSQWANKPMHAAEEFDWSMSAVIPQQLQALKQRGWNPLKQPLIGIAQAWGGSRKDKQSATYEAIPSAENMKTQSAAFCKAGAVSLAFYAWASSESSIFPENNEAMHNGVIEGVKACKDIWGKSHK